MDQSERILQTLEEFDLRDREAVDRILNERIDELNHSLVVMSYMSGKHPAVIANLLVTRFEESLIGMGLSSWQEFTTMIADALSERRHG